MVSLGIERVIDGHTFPRAETLVGADNGLTAAIGEHEVVPGDQSGERIVTVALDPIEGGWGINVPENGHGARAADVQDGSFEQLIENTDATRFDDQVSTTSVVERGVHTGGALTRVHHHTAPFGRIDIAVLLAAVSVGLVQRDRVPQPVQFFDYPA